MKNKNLTLGSLFDGSGVFPLGGILCGITPVWSSEIEPFPIRVTEKRLPKIKHYGDIKRLNGADLEPVDIITFGLPCQDMSIAGKRDGLGGSRSNLFFEAVRIIKEMRCATDGKYPRYAVWENVCGAFSSNKGEYFRCVLETLCKIKSESVSIPRYEKWNTAGEIMGDNFSLAWRTLDAQFWGVPQRRRRIFLVADFGGSSAGKILFESESVSGNFEKSRIARKGTAGGFEKGSGAASTVCLNAAGFCTEHSANSRSIGFEEETSPTLRAGTVPAAVCFENHSQDTRYRQIDDVAPTVSSTYGTGGNNQPFVVEKINCFDVRFTSEGTKNVRANVYETDVARTLDTGGTYPDRNQGGVAVVETETLAFSQDTYSKYRQNDKCGALRASGGMYGGGSETLVYSTSKNSYHTEAIKELANTLVASDYKDPPSVNQNYIIRRLTPTECARLQGFPDDWCSDLGEENPTEDEISRWQKIFDEYNKAIGKETKPKTEKQIRKWFKNPYSDSAAYKMWGNGVALPCVVFVLAGIAYFSSSE